MKQLAPQRYLSGRGGGSVHEGCSACGEGEGSHTGIRFAGRVARLAGDATLSFLTRNIGS
jgi:hypothetical protein